MTVRERLTVKPCVLLPQIATDLGAAPTGGRHRALLRLPFARRRVGLYLECGYAQPEASRTGVADSRVAGGSYDGTHLLETLTVGSAYRLFF